MPPETEVISCPACKHLLRVPADWLGTPVQCPECRSMFTAPVRDGDRLTEPALISRPADATAPRRKTLDAMLLIPAFGLLFVGVAGMGANGFLTVRFAQNPDLAKEIIAAQIPALRNAGLGATDPEDKRAEMDAARANEGAGVLRGIVAGCLAISAGVFAGGLAMATGRGYRVAQLGCVLAAVNVANGCCVPGAVFGVWGMLMLISAEGRAHFGR